MNLSPLALGNVGTNRLRRTSTDLAVTSRPARSFICRQPIEGRLLAHDRLHPAYPGGELRVFDVQFDIGGELALFRPMPGDVLRNPTDSPGGWWILPIRCCAVGRKPLLADVLWHGHRQDRR